MTTKIPLHPPFPALAQIAPTVVLGYLTEETQQKIAQIQPLQPPPQTEEWALLQVGTKCPPRIITAKVTTRVSPIQVTITIIVKKEPPVAKV